MLENRNIHLTSQKNKVLIFIFGCLGAFLVSLTSCEKLIILQLNDASPRVVIQGNIYDQTGPYYVKISKSVTFDESSTYPPVTGARVEISDNVNQPEVLTESLPGTYKTSRLRGIPGRKYSLSVITGSDTYQSVSTMPQAVFIDSLYFATNQFSGEKAATIRFNDPPNFVNFYRLVYFVNSVQQRQFYILDDELYQGASIKYALMSRDSGVKLVKGDNVTVWLESVDKGVFEYFRTTGHENGQSTSPANPVSNISNGALGYFNACSVRKISAIVAK
ncbi:MAG: DUF4249 domain-containing protein [Candidatus Omnitrophota bacterium]